MKNNANPQRKPWFLLTLSLFVFQLSLALAQTDPLATVDETPTFPGGIPALKKYLDTNLDFPLVADLAEERLVIVEFVINADGKPHDSKIIWGQNDTANIAAKKLINAMPKWFPGLNDDLPVSTWVRLPITYYRPVIKGRIQSDHAQISSEIRQSLYFDIDFPGAVTKATFPGGASGLKAYLAENLEYPRIAKENGVFGSVLVRFTVSKNGTPENFVVERGIGAGCDEEALRLLKMMPKWKPATLDGEPAAAKQMIYVPFKLEEDEFGSVVKMAEKMPSFPEGQAALLRYLGENIQYPDIAKENGVQGMVVVQMIVEIDGTLSNLQVVKGIGAGCDVEALRVVKLMPKWIPGMQRGKTVRVQFNLPIRFQLE